MVHPWVLRGLAHGTPVGMLGSVNPGMVGGVNPGMVGGVPWCILPPYYPGYTTPFLVYLHPTTLGIPHPAGAPCSCTPLPVGPSSAGKRGSGLSLENNMGIMAGIEPLGPKGVRGEGRTPRIVTPLFR